MSPVKAWAVFYADGSTFTSDDGGPADAPGLGVVVIAQADPEVGRMLMCRWDFYCWHEPQWWGHDLTGLIDCLALAGFNRVLVGRTVSQQSWREIYSKAEADPDFAPRSASLPLERPEGLR